MAAANDSESVVGGADRLKLETLANPDLGPSLDNRAMPEDRSGDKDNMMLLLLPSLPNLNAHPQKG